MGFEVVTLSLESPSPNLILGLAGRTVVSTDPSHFAIKEVQGLGIDITNFDATQISDMHVLLLPPPATAIDELVKIVDRLLGPGGCPWDQAQTHDSLKKYLLEEAHEVIDAIESGSDEDLREELGDVLLQPVMHGQISAQSGGFDTYSIAQGIVDKLVRRHPHVFGSVVAEDAEAVLKNWDQIKKGEKGAASRSVLAGVPRAMPALHRAYEVSKRAVRAGFEWPDIEGVFDKVSEELVELRSAIKNNDRQEIESELGDVLFTFVNLARWNKIDPEEALRKMVDRFSARFKTMESLALKPLQELSLEEWDELWTESKRVERA